MTTIEQTDQVHSLDVPVAQPQPRPQRLPWVIAAVAAAIAVLALMPKPSMEPVPPPAETETQQITDTFPGTDVTCRRVVDGTVTIEDRGGAGSEPYGHVVNGTGLAVCVWIVPRS